MGLCSAEIELTTQRMKQSGKSRAEIEAEVRKIWGKYERDGSTLKATGKVPTETALRRQVNAAYPIRKKKAAAAKKTK